MKCVTLNAAIRTGYKTHGKYQYHNACSRADKYQNFETALCFSLQVVTFPGRELFCPEHRQVNTRAPELLVNLSWYRKPGKFNTRHRRYWLICLGNVSLERLTPGHRRYWLICLGNVSLKRLTPGHRRYWLICLGFVS